MQYIYHQHTGYVHVVQQTIRDAETERPTILPLGLTLKGSFDILKKYMGKFDYST